MSVLTAAILIAFLDLGVIAAVAAIMCVPFFLDRGSEPTAVERALLAGREMRVPRLRPEAGAVVRG